MSKEIEGANGTIPNSEEQNKKRPKKFNRKWCKYGNYTTVPMHEKQFVLDMLNMIEDEAVRYRLGNLIVWYIDKAEQSKFKYYALTITTVVFNLMIPVANAFSGIFIYTPIITSGLAAVAGISLAVNSAGHYREHWSRYRSAAESLKEVMYQYVMKKQSCMAVHSSKCKSPGESGGCSGCCNPENQFSGCKIDEDLMKTISNHVMEENKQWEQTIIDDKSGDGNS